MNVVRSDVKPLLKDKVRTGLFELKVLSEDAVTDKSSVKVESPDAISEVRKVELELRRIELREFESKTQRAIRFRELQVEAMWFSNRPQSTDFGISRNVSVVPPFVRLTCIHTVSGW